MDLLNCHVHALKVVGYFRTSLYARIGITSFKFDYVCTLVFVLVFAILKHVCRLCIAMNAASCVPLPEIKPISSVSVCVKTESLVFLGFGEVFVFVRLRNPKIKWAV